MGGRYCRGCGSRGSAYPDFVRWRMKRKILSLIIFAACLILFCLPCFAGGLWNAPLIDIADGILSDDEISEITALAKDAAEKNKASVGIIFVNEALIVQTLAVAELMLFVKVAVALYVAPSAPIIPIRCNIKSFVFKPLNRYYLWVFNILVHQQLIVMVQDIPFQLSPLN